MPCAGQCSQDWARTDSLNPLWSPARWGDATTVNPDLYMRRQAQTSQSRARSHTGSPRKTGGHALNPKARSLLRTRRSFAGVSERTRYQPSAEENAARPGLPSLDAGPGVTEPLYPSAPQPPFNVELRASIPRGNPKPFGTESAFTTKSLVLRPQSCGPRAPAQLWGPRSARPLSPTRPVPWDAGHLWFPFAAHRT